MGILLEFSHEQVNGGIAVLLRKNGIVDTIR